LFELTKNKEPKTKNKKMTTTIIDTYQEVFDRLNLAEDSLQAQAFRNFKTLGFPNRKSEVYKYTDLSHFRQLVPNTHVKCPKEMPDYFKHEYLDKHLLVTINGKFCESLSNYTEDEGISIRCLCDAERDFPEIYKEKLDTSSEAEPDVFSELNTAFAHCGIFVYARKNARTTKPILVVNIGYNQTKDELANQRNIIIAEQGAEVEIIEDYINLSNENDFNINNFSEYFIAENASVKLTIYQEENNNLYFIGNKFFKLAANSRLKATAVNLCGKFVRNNFRVNLNGQNAEATVNGVFISEGSEHKDNRVQVNHNAPHCESFQTFKGILNHQSSGVFNGKIYVAEGAQKTNAYQSNKNVLLSEDATMNSKPELEIYADDVKCSHGATCGQLDENAIFYAESRGIPREKAKALIVFAFAQEVLQGIDNDDLRNFLERRLVNKLKLNEYSTYENVQRGEKN
jgi:Fe-S cluster assembly protein SufD